jgi:hypothetical protein
MPRIPQPQRRDRLPAESSIMSPNNPGNFVNDLVEMAKAFEALPKVQADLEQVRHDNDGYLTTIQRLELKLVDRANEIDSLNQRIRSLEVERDDAQFHALEADDRTSRALDFIKTTFGNAGSLIQALEPAPVKPAEPTPEPIPSWATPEVDHTGDYIPKAEPEGLHTTHPSEPSSFEPEPTPSKPEGGWTAPSPAPEVAQSHPTDAGNQSDVTHPLPAASPDNASTGDQSFSMPPQSPGHFEGKLYSEVVKSGNYPNRAEWEAGGGTIDNWYA